MKVKKYILKKTKLQGKKLEKRNNMFISNR